MSLQRWRAVLRCGATHGKPDPRRFFAYAGDPAYIISRGHYFTHAAAAAACARLPVPADTSHQCVAFFRQEDNEESWCDCGSYRWEPVMTHAAAHDAVTDSWHYPTAWTKTTRRLLGDERADEAPEYCAVCIGQEPTEGDGTEWGRADWADHLDTFFTDDE